MTAAGSYGPVLISGAFVSGDFFKVLRTTPGRGRFFTPGRRPPRRSARGRRDGLLLAHPSRWRRRRDRSSCALVHRIDPRIAWTSIRRGDMEFQEEAREMVGAIYAVGAAGAVALALSATGLYAVLSYLVALRRHEVSQTFASWNQIREWLRRLDVLRRVA